MLINPANAQETPAPATTAETAVPNADTSLSAPDKTNILIQNVGMIVLLVAMFYFLLIRPQQKRFKEHKEMVDSLKTGDKVIAAGLVGKIDTLVNNEEVVVDLGNGVKVTALRSMIQIQSEKTADKSKK